MAKKSSRPFRMAPVQECTLVPITDPAEIARIDEQVRRVREGAILAGVNGEVTTFTSEQVLDLCCQLPAAAKCQLLVQLAAELTPDQQLAVVQQVMAQLPSAAGQQHLTEELRTRVEKHSA